MTFVVSAQTIGGRPLSCWQSLSSLQIRYLLLSLCCSFRNVPLVFSTFVAFITFSCWGGFGFECSSKSRDHFRKCVRWLSVQLRINRCTWQWLHSLTMCTRLLDVIITTSWRAMCSLCFTAHQCYLNYCTSKISTRVSAIMALLCHIIVPWPTDTIVHKVWNFQTIYLLNYALEYRCSFVWKILGKAYFFRLSNYSQKICLTTSDCAITLTSFRHMCFLQYVV